MSTMKSIGAPIMTKCVMEGNDQGARSVSRWYSLDTFFTPNVVLNVIWSSITCEGKGESRKLSKMSLRPQLVYSMDTRRRLGRKDSALMIYRVFESVVPKRSCSPNGIMNMGCWPAALAWVSKVKLSELHRRSGEISGKYFLWIGFSFRSMRKYSSEKE